MFKVSNQEFEGPLGVLLNMIEQEKLDITAINLSKIADEYVEYVKSCPEIDPEELADFLTVAARLLWLKSKALLPYLESEDEETTDDLEKQLKMYKEFAQASLEIAKILKKKKFLFAPEISNRNRRQHFNLPVFVAPKNINKGSLRETMLFILRRLAKEEPLPEETIEEIINLEDRVLIIRKMLKQQAEFSWQTLIKNNNNKTEMIVSLLAILELIKQQELDFRQDTLFADIKLQRP